MQGGRGSRGVDDLPKDEHRRTELVQPLVHAQHSGLAHSTGALGSAQPIPALPELEDQEKEEQDKVAEPRPCWVSGMPGWLRIAFHLQPTVWAPGVGTTTNPQVPLPFCGK